ncbi:MAG TPA: AMP-binding protein [Solirubrobacteraceae bacterium]|nr:AMP-binding protein [Solirubrobacteraceae bacterium]
MSILAFQPEAERYYAEGFWRSEDLWEVFAAHAGDAPARTALHVGGSHASYGELERAAAALSSRLAAASLQRGDVVVLLGRNSVEAAVALLACFHLGAVAAPLPPMFGAAQLSALAAQANAKAVIGFGGEAEIAKCQALEGQVELVLALRPHDVVELASTPVVAEHESRGADELALLLHSSGTTSVPKGIMHTSNTLRYASEQIIERWELGPQDTNLVVCEFGFVGSLVFGYLVTLLSGATGVLLPRWDAEEALRLIEHHRCTYVLYMPTHGADILRAGRESTRDCSSLRVLAAPGLSPERRVAMHDVFGRKPLADYGLSEVPGHVSHALDEPWEKVTVTEGLPLRGTEVLIVDPLGEPVTPGETGEIVVNGPSRFLGFLANDALTRESLTPWGAYRTGDLGYLDADGHLVYAGRSKDIIRRGGVTVVPAEIEAAMLRHPAIHEVAVVALPDDRLGERACAAVVLEPGSDVPNLPELQAFLESEGLSKYSWPESVEVFEDFPRTPSLKVVKRDLVKLILDRTPAPA